MRLLVTGGCGFIGAGFCRRVKKQHPYLTLVNIDKLYPCSTCADDLTVSNENYTFIKGDIVDTNLILQLIETYRIDTIVHFAAQSHVDTSFTNPMVYTQDNVIGTQSLLEAVRKCGTIKKFIQISTDEVYGENAHGVSAAFNESSLLKPTNPYAASKASAEMYVHSYLHSYNIPAIVIRSNNVYGPGQYPEKVIPKFLFQLMDNQKITIQGSGHQLRSFLYVEDAVDAILCVLFQGDIGEIYNISSRDEISIKDLAINLIHQLKPGATVDNNLCYIEDRNFNDKRYWIESDPLAKLGWKPQWNLEQGLKETIDWFKTVDRNTYWSNKHHVALVWGGGGWIGGQFQDVLRNRGWTVICASSRADNRADVLADINKYNPTHIVCLIGRTHGPGYQTIDYLEQDGKLVENMTDNLYGPLVLAGVSKSKGLHMMYMGTGCIFEYDDVHRCDLSGVSGVVGFTEASAPNFFGSAYSTVKGFTDRLMNEEFADTVLNVRIRMPISSKDCPRNFISKIIAYKNICSIPNSMTVLDDILPCLAEALERGVKGPLNATNPGVIDHSTILSWYKEFQNPEHTWTEVSNTTLVSSLVKAARSNNYLDTARLTSLFPGLPTISESVWRIMKTSMFVKKSR
jgi:UDP-glucose 4,6-dehydratase